GASTRGNAVRATRGSRPRTAGANRRRSTRQSLGSLAAVVQAERSCRSGCHLRLYGSAAQDRSWTAAPTAQSLPRRAVEQRGRLSLGAGEVPRVRFVPGDAPGDDAIERADEPEHELARLPHGVTLGRLRGDVIAEPGTSDVVLQQRARVTAHEHAHAA